MFDKQLVVFQRCNLAYYVLEGPGGSLRPAGLRSTSSKLYSRASGSAEFLTTNFKLKNIRNSVLNVVRNTI